MPTLRLLRSHPGSSHGRRFGRDEAKLVALVLNDVKASESVFEARSRGKPLRRKHPQVSGQRQHVGRRDDR